MMLFDYLLVIPAALMLLTGLASLRHWRKRRLLRGSFYALIALSWTCLSILAFGVVINLHSYQHLSREQDLVQLHFKQLEPQKFLAKLEYPDGHMQFSTLYGDEWQLDARVLKWTNLASSLGIQASYQLERLSGRYHDPDQELSAPRSVQQLSNNAGWDVWQLIRRYPQWLPLVDAVYGSANFLPMRDNAVYQVSLSHNGLIARPENTAAEQAITDWE